MGKLAKLASCVVACTLIGYLLFSKNSNRKSGGAVLPSDTLVENISSDVVTLDPQQCGDNVSWRVILDLFTGLVGYDQKMQIQPTGAKSWEISGDGLVYTFHLRENARWSNGRQITADDYVYSYRRSVTPQTLTKYYIDQFMGIHNAKKIRNGGLDPSMLGVEAIDNFTLQIKLETRNPEFLDYLTLTAFMAVPRDTIEKYGNTWTDEANIVTSGPYKLEKWVHNGSITLTKNEFFWDKDNVSIPKIKFLMISDVSADYNNFVAGNEDITYYKLPSREIMDYDKEFNRASVPTFFVYDTLSQEKINFNHRCNKFKDVRVRKALSMTIDRDGLVAGIFKGGAVCYDTVPGCVCGGKFKDTYKILSSYSWVKNSTEDRKKEAKRLLNEVGYSANNPLRFKLVFPTGELHRNTASAIQEMWNTAFGGIVECSLMFDDWKIFLQRMDNNEYEIFRSSWSADYNLPSSFTGLYHSKSLTNFGYYANDMVDDILAKCDSARDVDEYNDFQKSAIKLIMNDYASIPLLCPPAMRLVSERVDGFDPYANPFGLLQSKWFRLK